jgi:hypothetical protein
VRIQPGIESLSSSILKLMDKGTTRLQNIQLLKWSEELKIGLAWNLLFGFPGEPPEEYDDMAKLIPVLTHLPPPTGSGTVRLDRFSPYWRAPDSYGIKNMRPLWTYDLVYAPLPPAVRSQIAYYFDYDHSDFRKPQAYAGTTAAAVLEWQTAYHKRHATLEVINDSGISQVLDSRAPGEPLRYVVDEAEAALLKVLDGATHRDAILRNLNERLSAHWQLSEFELAEKLNLMFSKNWLVREGDLILSIVIDRTERDLVINRRVEMQLLQFGLEVPTAAVETAGAMAF